MNKALRFLASVSLASTAFAFSLPSAAQSYSFGDFLSGTSVNDGGATWGTLNIADNGSNSYTFSLNLGSNFDDIFGSQSFVGSAIFNNDAPVSQLSATLDAGAWGVTTISTRNGPDVEGFSFDFGDAFGQSARDRLQHGEAVSWTSTFASPLTLVNPYVALHVQGIGSNGQGSGWYTPTSPIPEPETYAMLLVGLAVLGFVARRRERRLEQPA